MVPNKGSSVDSILGLLRRSTLRLTIAGLLSRMGVDMADGERPAGMWLAQIDGVDGYLIVTDRRLLFLAGAYPSKEPPPLQAWPLSGLVRVEELTRRRKPVLVINWQRCRSTVIGKLSAKDLPEVRSLLASHA